MCAGVNAEFHCVTSGASLQWSVDGVEAYRSAVQERNISFITTSYSKDGSFGYRSTLSVYGSIANSNSSIKCSALYNSVVYESDLAVLLVQGINHICVSTCAVVYIHVYVIYGFPIHTLHIYIGSLEASVNAAAMVLNTTHFLLTWSPPGDAINPALLNYIVVVRNGSAKQTQFATSVNETRAIVLLSLLSKCDTNFIIQPMCSTTAGSKTTGI